MPKRPRLMIDNRWSGNHGIGRYSREVVGRLGLEFTLFNRKTKPASPRDLLMPFATPSGSVTYSPGYNALISNAKQLVTVMDLIHIDHRVAPSRRYTAYYEHVLKPAIRRSGKVFTISRTSQIAIQNWLGDGSTVEVINAGIGLSASSFFAQNTPLPIDERKILYVGNAKPHKNFEVILNALHLVPDMRMRAIVPSSDVAFLEKQASLKNLGSRIQFLSGISEEQLKGEYSSAAVTVLPSIVEGFGLPALESMAAGTPVVYWEGCYSVAEILQGVGYPAKSYSDFAEWAELISKAASEPRNLVSNDLELRYNWSCVAQTVEKHLNEYLSL